ncbi:MAG: hypothetical protein IJ144_02895 [Prevotella sp.]|nr:hypothetical protein [Prevotella sp.]
MKKIYITPATQAILMDAVLLQAASTETVGVKEGKATDPNKLLGRRGYYDPELDEELEEEEEF